MKEVINPKARLVEFYVEGTWLLFYKEVKSPREKYKECLEEIFSETQKSVYFDGGDCDFFTEVMFYKGDMYDIQ